MSSDRFPNVDVVVAAWNSSDTVARAMRSALADPAVRRVIVVDDASDDTTFEAARAVDDGGGRVVVERLPNNVGPASARNHAISLGDGEWIAVLDADDFVEPGRMSRLRSLATDADFVADDLLQVRDAELGAVKPAPLLGTSDSWWLSLELFVEGNISAWATTRKELGFLKPIMRRSFLAAHDLAYLPHLRLGEDFALYSAALAKGARFLVVPAQGYISVVREGSLSGRHSQRDLIGLRDNDLSLLNLAGLSANASALLQRHYRSLDARVQWLELIEAVKSGDLLRCVPPFFRSAEVSTFLARKLAEQIRLRSFQAIRRGGLRGSLQVPRR